MCSVAGQPLAVTGTVFDFANPQVAATLTSPSLNPVRLSRALPALTAPAGLTTAPGPVTVNFTGTVKNPTITVNLAFPSVTYGGNTATNITARATYAGKVLSVPSASFALPGGGAASLHGTVNTSGKTPAVLMAGTVSGLNLSALRLPASPALKSLNLGGLANAQFVVGSGGGPVLLTANVEAQNLRLQQTQFQLLAGRVAWKQGGPVTVAKLVVRGPQGTLTAAGTVPVTPKSGSWNLVVRAAGLDVPSLLRPYSKLALGGSASFDGKIVGPLSAPQAVGAVRLVAPRFGRYAADFVSGSVTASASDVRLDNVTLRRFPAVVGVSGTVRQLTGGNPALDLNVRLSQGDVRDFLQLATSASAASPKTAKKLTASLPNLTGTADGAFQITGRAQSPVVTGHARVLEATVAGYRVDEVGADILYAGGAVRLENGVLKSEGATLRVSGVYSAKGTLLAQFAGSDINLSRFHQFVDPYAEVSGTAALSGRVAGTVQSPRVVLSALTVPNLIVDRQEFAPLSLAAIYNDGVLTQTGQPWRFVVQVPPEVAGEKGGPVEYDVNALALTLPTLAHPKRAAALTLSAAIPEAAPEHLSHIFSTIRRSPWSRSEGGQAVFNKAGRPAAAYRGDVCTAHALRVRPAGRAACAGRFGGFWPAARRNAAGWPYGEPCFERRAAPVGVANGQSRQPAGRRCSYWRAIRRRELRQPRHHRPQPACPQRPGLFERLGDCRFGRPDQCECRCLQYPDSADPHRRPERRTVPAPAAPRSQHAVCAGVRPDAVAQPARLGVAV